jgi:hypothetical protein
LHLLIIEEISAGRGHGIHHLAGGNEKGAVMNRTLGFTCCTLGVFFILNCCISIGLIQQPNLRLIPEVEPTLTPTVVDVIPFSIPVTGCPCVPCPQQACVVNAPTPLPPRPSAPTCFEILDARDNLTSAQWDNLLEEVRHSRIDGWDATVLDVSRELSLQHGYRVNLTLDGGCALAFTLRDKNLALSLQRGQVLTVSGPVQYAYRDLSGCLVITLPDNTAVIQ